MKCINNTSETISVSFKKSISVKSLFVRKSRSKDKAKSQINASTHYFIGSGVYFGQLDFNPLDSCDNITAETKLLQYLN